MKIGQPGRPDLARLTPQSNGNDFNAETPRTRRAAEFYAHHNEIRPTAGTVLQLG
jgi:hypothetical protein